MKEKTSSVIVFLLILGSVDVYPFEPETHRVLSVKASLPASSNLDEFLKLQLNLSGGVNETLADLRIIQWIGEGGVREDDGIRPLNHFHNPLRTWDQASDFGFSSICWAQATNCQGGAAANDFSWQNARQSYYDGLTASTQTTREEKLALAFRILGHQIHLIQDAAVPAHTRNDAHPPFLNPDGFESFAGMILGSTFFNQIVSNPTSRRRIQA